jgi:hypothetical protein
VRTPSANQRRPSAGLTSYGKDGFSRATLSEGCDWRIGDDKERAVGDKERAQSAIMQAQVLSSASSELKEAKLAAVD